MSKKKQDAPRPSLDRVLTISETAAVCGVRRECLWRWERAGAFPRRRLLGPTLAGRRGYLESEIAAWLASRPTTVGDERLARIARLPRKPRAGR